MNRAVVPLLLALNGAADPCTENDIQIVSESYLQTIIDCLHDITTANLCVSRKIPNVNSLSQLCLDCTFNVVEVIHFSCWSACIGDTHSDECRTCWPAVNSAWQADCLPSDVPLAIASVDEGSFNDNNASFKGSETGWSHCSRALLILIFLQTYIL